MNQIIELEKRLAEAWKSDLEAPKKAETLRHLQAGITSYTGKCRDRLTSLSDEMKWERGFMRRSIQHLESLSADCRLLQTCLHTSPPESSS